VVLVLETGSVTVAPGRNPVDVVSRRSATSVRQKSRTQRSASTVDITNL
jgi:hypothetical protein